MSNTDHVSVPPSAGGAHRDPFDPKDQYFVPNPKIHIDSQKDLRIAHPEGSIPVYNQGQTQSCTANAIAAAFWYEERVGRHTADWATKGPSRLFMYWNARGGFEDNFASTRDDGAILRSAVKGLALRGTCKEDECPFPSDDLIALHASDEQTAQRLSIINTKPSAAAFKNALNHKITLYKRLDADRPEGHDQSLPHERREKFGAHALEMLRACLAEGYPVAFSYWYYLPASQSFLKRKEDGKVILKDIWSSSPHGPYPRHLWIEELASPFRPVDSEGKLVDAGHSVLAVGYDDAEQLVLVRNSWGARWGNEGYFYVPYAWISDFAATNDFWTVRSSEVKAGDRVVLWEEREGVILGKTGGSEI